MQKKIFASYGVLAHEKHPLYTADAPAGEVYDEIVVNIPYELWETQDFATGITIEGKDYLLNDVLTNFGDAPVLSWRDTAYQKRRIHLETVGGKTDRDED